MLSVGRGRLPREETRRFRAPCLCDRRPPATIVKLKSAKWIGVREESIALVLE